MNKADLAGPLSPRFCGRAAELAALNAAYDDAAGGDPRVVLLGAEAGGGKSRLVQEFVARIDDRALVLVGSSVELSEAALPYAPFTAALRDLVRVRSVDAVSELVDGATELAWLLPEFGTPPVSSAGPEMARARLFEVFLRLLEKLAGEQPVVLVVEDAHWADDSTRDLLSFLTGNLRHGALLMVVTFRFEELRRGHPLRPLLARMARSGGVISVTLPRLTRLEVADQLEGILGRPASAAVVESIYDRGDGVPLFTEAMTKADGTVRADLPSSLSDLLLEMVQGLPDESQQVLRAAAVGGRRVGHGLLAAVTRLDEASLTEALRPAAAANVVISDADGYAFRHSLIREAVSADLLAGERARWHRAFAEALEETQTLAGGVGSASRLAVHWQGAHDDERALRAAWTAAGESRRGLGYAEQLRMLEQVLRLWQSAPAAAADTGVDHVGALELAADAALWAGRPERGLTLVEIAIGELGGSGGERLAALLLRRAELRQERLQPGQLDDLRAALQLASHPGRIRAQALGQLARVLMRHDLREEALPLSVELSDLADAAGDDEIQAEALITRAHLGTREGEDTIGLLNRALELAGRSGSVRLELLAYVGLTHANESRGNHEAAIDAGRAGLLRTSQLGSARYVAELIAQNLAESLVSAGHWDEALETVQRALDLDPAPYGRVNLLLCRGRIAVARGETAVIDQTFQELAALSDPRAEAQQTLPRVQLELEQKSADGDLAGALTVAATVPDLGRGADPRYVWPLLAASARICAESGSTEELEAVAAATSTPWPVEKAHAQVFAAELTSAPDPSAWDTAAAAWGVLSRPYPQAYALMRSAIAAAALGDRPAAADSLRQAAALASGIGAHVLHQQVSRLAVRMKVDLVGSPGGTAVDEPFHLTERELEVLRLIATGRSNREIAGELFISPKTASVHVSNILAKLGVASRGAAAATAHRLRLFDLG
ncbi:AAA family ATPase [Streptomyces sp. SID13031]|uniref:helix-turn-helix transcriptional regulator n=1 Tax=Streptomyces sp. SID13031 TaxID=2706046 RepID=UPI0013C932B8|nr:AAA family ATPase [Streptomyces sp. SID13031]NEA31244.1 AAA family ATPase [Streptomyces sp. SID13031]